jgi:hypothetical protein
MNKELVLPLLDILIKNTSESNAIFKSIIFLRDKAILSEAEIQRVIMLLYYFIRICKFGDSNSVNSIKQMFYARNPFMPEWDQLKIKIFNWSNDIFSERFLKLMYKENNIDFMYDLITIPLSPIETRKELFYKLRKKYFRIEFTKRELIFIGLCIIIMYLWIILILFKLGLLY